MKKRLVISNDAGGANMLASYFYFNNYKISTALSGPAVKVFKQYQIKCLEYKRFDIEKLISSHDIIYTGTGWQTNLEKKAIETAKIYNKKIITFFDHWYNPEERFLLNKKKFLPDEIWVNNGKLFKLLLKNPFFFETKIKLISNTQKKYSIELYKKIKKKKTCHFKILFLCEPFSNKIDGFSLSKIIKSLIFFLKKNKKKIILCIRPHPSQNINNFKFINKLQYNKISIYISKTPRLEKDIKNSDIVVGCNSFALVIALWLKKKTFYFFDNIYKSSFIKNNKVKNLRNAKF